MTELPFAVDTSNQAAWWSPVDVFDGVTYFAFDAPASTASRHEVHIAAQGPDGVWTSGCLRDAAGSCATFLDDNGHNQPSIVVDGAGTIHAFVSMHHEQWNYFRSTTPGDVDSLVDVTNEMPDLDATITYPVTARGPEGEAWVLVRSGADAQGRRDGVLYRYAPSVGQWEREVVVGAATGASFYPDDVEVDEKGRVHLLWEWGPFPAGPARHVGSYAVYDPATGGFADAAGDAAAAPLTPLSGGATVWLPLEAGEALGSTTPSLQSAKLAVRANTLAGVAYRRTAEDGSAYDIRHAMWDGSRWTHETLVDVSGLGSGSSTVAAIDMTSFGARTRVYGVIGVQVCGVLRSQVVMLEAVEGRDGWAVSAIGGDVVGQQRLRAAVDGDGADVLYISAPATAPGHGSLFAGLVPRTGAPDPGTSLASIVANVRGDRGGTNVAHGAVATASSSLRSDTGAQLAFDGACTDGSRWISAVGDPSPWIEGAWAEPTAIDLVRVRSGYSSGVPSQSVLRDFSVELRSDGTWVEIGRVDDNVEGTVSVEADGLVADGVRLLITDPSSSSTDVARVYEIEVIAAEG